MSEQITNLLLSAVGGGVLLYIVQYLMPSKQSIADAERTETETEILSQKLVLEISEKYKKMAEDAADRERHYQAIIDELRTEVRNLEEERAQLMTALNESKAMIDELRQRLDMEKRQTQTYPYLSTLARIFTFAEREQWDYIVPEIRELAKTRPSLREQIHESLTGDDK